MTHRINPPELAKPSGFSHAVVVPSTWRTVYLAGQTGMDAEGRIIDGNIVEQFEQALSNLLVALRESGGRPQDLVSLTIYTVDMEGYKSRSRGIGKVWQRLVGTTFPAVAGIGVARLWDAEALVEVQGIAAIPPEGGKFQML